MSSVTGDELVVQHRTVQVGPSRGRRTAVGIVLVVLGLFSALVLAATCDAAHADFDLDAGGAQVHLPTITVPAVIVCVLLGALTAAAGAYHVARGFSPRALRWVGAAAGVAFLLAFLTWAGTGGKTVQLTSILQQTLLLATPLILGAMGGVLCERSGVINVAIEGQMLAGAFAGALLGTAGGLAVGLVGAVVVGGLMGLLLAVFAIRFLVNQVILGVVLNVLALGLTGFLFDALMANDQNSTNNPGFFSPVKIPLLGDIPVIGPVLFDQNVIVYAMYLIVAAIDIALVRTRWGLRTRAVGEHPKAADTVGINVLRLRYQNVVLGGCVAGLAGAFLTIGNVGQFTKNISSGQGFIALAAVIFGRWTPRGALGAALLFGFATALQSVLSFTDPPLQINSNLLGMLPYVATLLAVAGLVGRVRAPAADGEPYVKG